MSGFERKTHNPEAEKRAAILDLDGTLLDTESVTTNIFEDFLARYGIEQDKRREKNRRVGMTEGLSCCYC